MIPTYKPYRLPSAREYTGHKPRDLPIRYQPRETCYIAVTSPREPKAPYVPSEQREDAWDWNKGKPKEK